MTSLTDTPIRSDRQAGRQASAPAGRTLTSPNDRQAGHCAATSSQHSVASRCWADGGQSELIRQVTVECQSLADPKSRLGLCRRHQEEIVGG